MFCYEQIKQLERSYFIDSIFQMMCPARGCSNELGIYEKFSGTDFPLFNLKSQYHLADISMCVCSRI